MQAARLITDFCKNIVAAKYPRLLLRAASGCLAPLLSAFRPSPKLPGRVARQVG